jgi:hypothetical protein
MRLVLASPLYPPDVAWPASYIKELAKRLAEEYEVTIVTYGRLPEQVRGVKIVAIDKRRMLPLRLIAYTIALWGALRRADVIYAQNGPSVELPLVIANFFLRRPLIAQWGDVPAHAYAQEHFARRMIERAAFGHAKMINESPLPKPEILPLEPRPEAALAQWEESWQEHVRMLKAIFYAN